ncbi:nucleoside triphosphate pyrophosphohydrolase [Hymenobacter sp. 102]|uniref:nucleoside triphosphate pyrophosphohydrolase n=1 Tax=Hymenobacter sp. 102 TaxID=3403152 RepID=UPI003CEBCFA2
MFYNKLIRDHIPAIITQSGRQCRTATMPADEYNQALRAKLVEEALEVQAARPEELLQELADVLEVVQALAATHGLALTTVEAMRQQRHQERGGFTQRLKLLEILPADSRSDA